jgi:adenylate cyclase
MLDDLHWADDASLELLVFLLDSLRLAPLFLVLISRQVQNDTLERIVAWSRQNMGARFHEFPLQSLSQDQSRQLLDMLLSIPDLPEKLRDQIVLRAAGIPFYLEEILRMLIDEGILRAVNEAWQVVPGADVAGLGVPDTLQELILARFDRLQPSHRRVLQVASVIGKDFSLPVLAPMLLPAEQPELHNAIDTLVEHEFIQPRLASPETEYTFRHVLMSDAIYGTMLRKERSALHTLAAETIERMFPDHLDDQVDLLANHYRWSLAHDRALYYAILAGQKAVRNQANYQAAQYFESAVELMQSTPFSDQQAFTVYLGLGDTQMFFGDYPKARECYKNALAAINHSTGSLNVEERSLLNRRMARTYERLGDYDQALAHLVQAQASLDRAPEEFPVERAAALNDRAWLAFRRGSAQEAETLLYQALRLAESTDAYDEVASIYNRLGGVAYQKGDLDQAANYLRRSIAIREEARDLVNLATSLNNLGVLEIEMGELDRSLETITRGYQLKTRLGQPEGMAMSLTNLGWLRIQRGELEEARRDLEKARALSAQIGYSSLQCQILRMFGELALMAEDWTAAMEHFNEYLKCIDEQEQEVGETQADAYRLLAEAALGQGQVSAAHAWIDPADRVHAEAEDKSKVTLERGDYLRLKGMLAMQQKDWRSAEQYFNRSLAVFSQLRSGLNQARIYYQQGLLAEAQTQVSEAQRLFALAEQNFLVMGARLDEQRAHQARIRLKG